MSVLPFQPKKILSRKNYSIAAAHSAGPGPWAIGLCSRDFVLKSLFAQEVVWSGCVGCLDVYPWVSEIHPKWLKGVHFCSIWAQKSLQQGPWEPFWGAWTVPNCVKSHLGLPKSTKTSIKSYKNTPSPMMTTLF